MKHFEKKLFRRKEKLLVDKRVQQAFEKVDRELWR
jgi:hypothetical protein